MRVAEVNPDLEESLIGPGSGGDHTSSDHCHCSAEVMMESVDDGTWEISQDCGDRAERAEYREEQRRG